VPSSKSFNISRLGEIRGMPGAPVRRIGPTGLGRVFLQKGFKCAEDAEQTKEDADEAHPRPLS
jgi:hypothetical protein